MTSSNEGRHVRTIVEQRLEREAASPPANAPDVNDGRAFPVANPG